MTETKPAETPTGTATQTETAEPAAGFQEAVEKAREIAEDLVGTRRMDNAAGVTQPEWVDKLAERDIGGKAAEGGSTFDSTADISTGRSDTVGIETPMATPYADQAEQQAEQPTQQQAPTPTSTQARDTESNAPRP